MTAINVIQTHDAIYLFSDGAFIDSRNGQLNFTESKVRSNVPGRFTVGVSGPHELLVHTNTICSDATSIEQARSDIEAILPKLFDLIESNEGAFEITLVGFAEGNERRFYRIGGMIEDRSFATVRCDDDAWVFSPTIIATTMQKVLGSEKAGQFNRAFNERLSVADPIATGALAIDAQRLVAVSNQGNSIFAVGGFVQMTKITADAIESKILKRWSDRVGHRIQPGSKIPVYQGGFGSVSRGGYVVGLKAASDTLRGIVAGSSSNYDTSASAASGYVAPVSGGIDSNALIVLHMDGSDNGTTFTDSASSPNTVTATGSAVTHTTSFGTPKFGSASGKFPAAGGLTIPDSAALRPGTGDFTIDFWVRYNATGNQLTIYDKGLNAANALNLSLDNGASPKIQIRTNASLVLTETTGTALNTWTHKALVRLSGVITIYSNGVANGSVSNSTNISSTGSVGIGVRGDGSTLPLDGNLDEFRYSNVARWTTTFTPPTAAYASGYQAMTLTTTAQTSSTSVSNARVLLEFDNTATPTLNTDLVVEVTCNGGSNWATATLSSVTPNSQGGRSVVETADTACTSGTSFQARITTPTGKLVPIYGISIEVN